MIIFLAELDPSSVNRALDQSLNHPDISIPTRLYIRALCTFLSKFPDLRTLLTNKKMIYNIHYLYIMMTLDQSKVTQYWCILVQLWNSATEYFSKSIAPGQYDVFNCMSTRFGTIIDFDEDKGIFYMASVYVRTFNFLIVVFFLLFNAAFLLILFFESLDIKSATLKIP